MKQLLHRKKQILLINLFLISVVLSGCGTTGQTTRFIVPMDLDQGLQVRSEIRIASVSMDKDAASLTNIGTYRWGMFDNADLSNIEESLRITLAPLLPAALPQPISRMDIHLVIRRYVVIHSNTGGGVMACVAWAATDSKGKMIYHEQFYSSNEVYMIGTVGLLKDSVHRAIVRRIIKISIYLASGRGDPGGKQTANKETYSFTQANFMDTYTSFEEALLHVPQQLISVQSVSPKFINVLGSTVSSQVGWQYAIPPEEFNWKKYLHGLYKN